MNRSRLLSLAVLFLTTFNAEAAPMQRLVRVIDATTLVVEHEQLQTAVTLAAVEVPPERRAETIAYLQTMIGDWVLVENGNVYRSPDGVFINAEVRRRLSGDPLPPTEKHVMTYLGAAAPAPPQRTRPPAPAPAVRTPRPRNPRHKRLRPPQVN